MPAEAGVYSCAEGICPGHAVHAEPASASPVTAKLKHGTRHQLVSVHNSWGEIIQGGGWIQLDTSCSLVRAHDLQPTALRLLEIDLQRKARQMQMEQIIADLDGFDLEVLALEKQAKQDAKKLIRHACTHCPKSFLSRKQARLFSPRLATLLPICGFLSETVSGFFLLCLTVSVLVGSISKVRICFGALSAVLSLCIVIHSSY